MALIYRQSLVQNARRLRGQMTDAEVRLWARIRLRRLNGLQFYRQRVIGSYIVDFYCPKARLVIEVDGSQHYAGKTALADVARDEYLRSNGLKVLRFSDTDVLLNTDGVAECILEESSGANPP